MKLARGRSLVITLFILRNVSLADQRRSPGNSIEQWRREARDDIKTPKTSVTGINTPKKMRQITTRPFHHTFLNYKGPTKHVGLSHSKPSVYTNHFNDPAWNLQWYVDYRTAAIPVMDHNVVPVYNMNITGRDVTVALVDVGLDTNHPDFHNNVVGQSALFRSNHSTGKGEQSDPKSNSPPSHGLACAGLIGMEANNGICGVGIAYGAKITSVSAIHSSVTDNALAEALVFGINEVDIYSNSWGPEDDGRMMRQLGSLTADALKRGAEQGRGGKGAIYVFGGGSGRTSLDSCSADAFVNNINTISVGSANKNGKLAYFTERCAAIMATAYASENVNDDLMVTLGENGLCVQKDLGNSGSIALASGILALVLQANSKLTHRDVMHLIAVGSEVAPLADNDNTWFKNSASFWVSSDFGFGLLNAQNMVLLAQEWRNVGPRISCFTPFNLKKPALFSLGSDVVLRERYKVCDKKVRVQALEHVQLIVTVESCFRGGVTINITSPKGTVSTMLEPRPLDDSGEALVDWSMTSVQFWGEDPHGEWKFSIGTVFDCERTTETDIQSGSSTGSVSDPALPTFIGVSMAHDASQINLKITQKETSNEENLQHAKGVVRKVELHFYGTSEKPFYHETLLPRKYSAFRLPDDQNSAF